MASTACGAAEAVRLARVPCSIQLTMKMCWSHNDITRYALKCNSTTRSVVKVTYYHVVNGLQWWTFNCRGGR